MIEMVVLGESRSEVYLFKKLSSYGAGSSESRVEVKAAVLLPCTQEGSRMGCLGGRF